MVSEITHVVKIDTLLHEIAADTLLAVSQNKLHAELLSWGINPDRQPNYVALFGQHVDKLRWRRAISWTWRPFWLMRWLFPCDGFDEYEFLSVVL